MATENPHIGTRIRLARERLLWSQQQLADATGVDVKTVRNWEKTGRVRNRRGKLEEVLGISFDDDTNGGAPPATRSAGPAEALTRLDNALAELAGLRDALRDDQGKARHDEGTRRARRTG